MTMQRTPLVVAVVALLVGVGVAVIGGIAAADAPLAPPRLLPEVPATSNSLEATRAQNSPALAVDPTDERFVVLAHRIDAPAFGCSLQVSGDGGRGWVGADPVPELPRGAERCYSPEVAFDDMGRLYYLFVGLAGPGNTPTGVYLATSDDRARSFTRPMEVLGEGNYQVRMVIDRSIGPRGRLHLVWLQTSTPPPTGGFAPSDNPIVAAHSDDGGETFSQPVRLSPAGPQRVVGPRAVVGPDGTLHVTYFDLRDDLRDYQGLQGPVYEGEWSVLATRSVDGGATFAPSVVVDDRMRPRDRVILIFTMPPPGLGAGPEGQLYVAWEDARSGDSDVLVSRSMDGGASWSEPLRVNDDASGNGATQYLPELAVAPDGRIDVIFYDRRDDPRDLFNHTYYTFSQDGGATFAANMRLTSDAGTSRSGQRYLIPSSRGRNDIGSRLALAASEDDTLAAWADTRNAAVSPYQDVFTATIDHVPAQKPLLFWSGLALATAAAVVLVVLVLRSRTGRPVREAGR